MSSGRSARVYVTVTVEGLEEPFLALLDTGAAFSVLAKEIAEEIGLSDSPGQRVTLDHKGGKTGGRLVPTTITLVADQGEGLRVETTVFIPDDEWPEPRNFIGYGYFLERIRLGLDPQSNHIYFGGYAEPLV